MTSNRRLSRSVATALAVPIVALPLAAPAVAAVASTTTYAADIGSGLTPDLGSGFGPGFDSGFGPGLGRGPWQGGLPFSDYGASTIDSELANDAESTGVVLINTTVDYGSAQGAGTGLAITDDGIVVTNHHVVEGATSIAVTDPSTAETYEAEVLGYDDVRDVAVLQLDRASGLATVATDKSAATQGEAVTSVGNAGGQGELSAADGTVTDPSTAITVTNDDGTTADLSDLIETDADIVSGDSGGALLDADGEVIGMNVAATSGSADVSGYAIPIGTVLDIAAQIIAGEESGGAEGGDITDQAPGGGIAVSWVDTASGARTETVTLGAGPVA